MVNGITATTSQNVLPPLFPPPPGSRALPHDPDWKIDDPSHTNSAIVLEMNTVHLLSCQPVDRRRSRATSTIQTWIFRVHSRQRRRQNRIRNLRRRWEREIHRIAATRMQAVVRGALARQGYRRRVQHRDRAAREVQRVVRGARGRLEAAALASRRCYIVVLVAEVILYAVDGECLYFVHDYSDIVCT